MSDTPEPLASILAEMREWSTDEDDALARYADRIEAAAKREEDRRRDEVMSLQRTIVKMQDAIARQADAVNAAALRSALESIEDDCRVLDRKDMWEEEGECYYDTLRDIREKVSAALAAPPEPPSNAAAMRAALENARSKFIHIKKCADEGEVSRKKLAILCEFVSQEIAAALSKPARNCDVGTAEEQAERHERFCDAHYKADAVDAQCFGCPACNKKETDCEFIWGQLPFAPAEGGDHA